MKDCERVITDTHRSVGLAGGVSGLAILLGTDRNVFHLTDARQMHQGVSVVRRRTTNPRRRNFTRDITPNAGI